MKNIPNEHPLFMYSTIKVKYNNQIKERRVAFAGVIDNNTINIGEAVCSEKDIFDKKIGRQIALGRAIKKPVYQITIEDDKKPSDLFVNFCKDLISNKEFENI